jgi:hypothetical protein
MVNTMSAPAFEGLYSQICFPRTSVGSQRPKQQEKNANGIIKRSK